VSLPINYISRLAQYAASCVIYVLRKGWLRTFACGWPNFIAISCGQSFYLRNQSTLIDDRFFYFPRISFDFQPHQTSWTVERRQFSLRLAYAITFNSCQGLTLDKVVLDLTIPVFAHGQLYTSLSRVRRGNDVHMLLSSDKQYCSSAALSS
jgi:hypothetical protein